MRRHILFPEVHPGEGLLGALARLLRAVRDGVRLFQIEVSLIITLMMQWVIKVLEPDPIIDLVHAGVLMKEILVLAALEHLKTAGLGSLNIVGHQPPLDASLQYQFRRRF